ncbi:mitochondrial carrier domain-containing protein [Melampsora americana]|nr:mitochondrial carrier domain-containing protein [Melampsora americana]
MSHPAYRLTAGEGFVAGGLGAGVAITFMNPIEVAERRLQTTSHQAGQSVKRYRTPFDVLKDTVQSEGWRSCQRGLCAAYAYQFALNGSRLGFYEPIRRNVNTLFGYDPSNVKMWICVSSGGLSGLIGATLAHPILLVKNRIQASSPSSGEISTLIKKPKYPSQPVSRSLLEELVQITRQDGVKAWTRGVDKTMLRTAMGSSVQLPTYNYTKMVLRRHFESDPIWLYVASSSCSALCGLLVLQPLDIIIGRMHNESTNRKTLGTSLSSFWKMVKSGGISGLYNGSTAHFLKLAPHTIITLAAYEAIGQWWIKQRLATTKGLDQ